jgi:branched-chain amino acid transport system ATP-binding protein
MLAVPKSIVVSIESTRFGGCASAGTRRPPTLSGGEQQMRAIGRGLMSAPQLLMMEELSLGLSPLLVDACRGALPCARLDA